MVSRLKLNMEEKKKKVKRDAEEREMLLRQLKDSALWDLKMADVKIKTSQIKKIRCWR